MVVGAPAARVSNQRAKHVNQRLESMSILNININVCSHYLSIGDKI